MKKPAGHCSDRLTLLEQTPFRVRNSEEIVVYRPEEAAIAIDVRVKDGTIYLTLTQIAQLFGRDKSVISRHLSSIYREGELSRASTVAKNATVQIESGRRVKRTIEFYNLDAILSVGYRVNSKEGTQFRIWATNVLRDYLVKGIVTNQRLERIENNYEELSKEVKAIGHNFKPAVFLNKAYSSKDKSLMLMLLSPI